MRTFTRIAIALAAAAGLVGATLPATASSAATTQWTTLKEAPATVSNPMKGFMPWAPEDGGAPGAVANALPYTLEWAPFPVNTVVTGHDTYDFYDNKRISFSPNYNDPKVQEKLLRFVAALGDRYDGDPRIGFITAGLYGFWGEEHTYPYNGAVSSQNPAGINWMPSEEFRAQLVEAWDDAFDETFIQNRYPIEATKAHGMGYYDDSFGYATLEGTSWHFIPKLKKQGEGDAWQHSPIGGELTRAKATSAAMGYTLQETRTSVTYNQVKATVVAEIKNTGVAPFYATWPLEVILVDENNEIVTSQTIESTLPSILPDQTGKVTARLPLPEKFRSNDSAQKLTAVIRVENPLPNGAPVAFANKAMNKPLPGYLELGKLTRGRAPKN